MAKKIRLDMLMHQLGLAESREQAKRLILAGEVLVDRQLVDKAATPVAPEAEVTVKQPPPYVSRGGQKIEHALDVFGVQPAGYVVADFGASTGGFTDCVLQRGARRVYAIDVGYGQLHWRLRQDERVVVMERVNVRYLQELPEPIDLVTIDASFISLKLLLPAAARVLQPEGAVIALIKPQFEAGRRFVGKGGVVRKPEVHRQVLQRVIGDALANDWALHGLVRSPLTGPKGNIEFLMWLTRADAASGRESIALDVAVASVL